MKLTPENLDYQDSQPPQASSVSLPPEVEAMIAKRRAERQAAAAATKDVEEPQAKREQVASERDTEERKMKLTPENLDYQDSQPPQASSVSSTPRVEALLAKRRAERQQRAAATKDVDEPAP